MAQLSHHQGPQCYVLLMNVPAKSHCGSLHGDPLLGQGMMDCAHLESHILEGAIAEGGLQARLGHILSQVGVLVQAPVLDEVVHLCLDFPASS